MHLALLAYNRGPARVDEILAQGGNPANGYSDAVLKGYRPSSRRTQNASSSEILRATPALQRLARPSARSHLLQGLDRDAVTSRQALECVSPR